MASCSRHSYPDAMSHAVHPSIQPSSLLMEYSRLTEQPSQVRDSPIIVGERYELAEAVATNCTAPLYSGFLAKPEYNGALLPMSDYGKSSDADLIGFETKRPSDGFSAFASYNLQRDQQEPEYLQYVYPGRTNSQVQLSTTAYDHNADQIAFGASSDYNIHSSYNTTAPEHSDPVSQKIPASSSYTSRKVKIESQGTEPFDPANALLDPSPGISRKRKLSHNPADYSVAAKRVSPTRPLFGKSQDQSPYPYTNASLAYPQELQSTNVSSTHSRLTLVRPQGQRMDQDDRVRYSAPCFDSSHSDSQYLMQPPMSQTSGYNSTHQAHQNSRSPAMSSTTSVQMSTSSSPNPANPPLVRVRPSTLQQSSDLTSTSAGETADGTFVPYGMYPNRAEIKICGDLNTMRDDWSPDEVSAKRRLVRFTGQQNGRTINTYFKAIRPDERHSPAESREKRVSCIYWEERDEYFVTSVDTIALLETLVGARFQVDEKNRIRRNLETHHPFTVSKAKADTESFFKVIMGFPTPKPRNIEKDVKVFPWSILEQALKKVISKYSPSPASVVGARSCNFSGVYSDSSSDRYAYPSSRSSTGSSAYTSTVKSSLLSPSTTSHGPSVQYSQPSPMAAAVSSLPQSYHVPTLASQYSHNDAGSLGGSGYTEQTPLPDFSHMYTSIASGRRRSSDASISTFGASSHTTRPRANTSSSASYHPKQDATGYTLEQLPSSLQPARPSWDYAFLRSEPGSFSHDLSDKFPSRRNSQYQQGSSSLQTSQAAL